MKKVFVFLGVILFFGLGFMKGLDSDYDPYELNYNKVVINLPIPYADDMVGNKMIVGEKYLAFDLAVEFEKNGFETKIYSIEDTYSNRNFGEGFEFIMRKWPELRVENYHSFVDKDRIAVLYETVPYNLMEVRRADIVFTGSMKKNEDYRKRGINSYFIPQFTRLDKFYPAYNEKYKSKLLFVGNRWPNFASRKTVSYAINNGIEIDIYGADWENVLVGDNIKMLKGFQLKNEDLKYYYSSADIVFNDTRDDMIMAGYISNRIFDATACGAFVISDYNEAIEDIYGDSIPMYKNEEEFVNLVKYYSDNPLERQEKAKRAHNITKERFGAEKVISEMAKIMREYAKEKKLLRENK
ncbi:MAG: glycosyltransferase [Alphaproteobacteria bacterium]|nr:glycosyltransferase [Alphaproteobacteria bacterium]